MVCLSRTTTIQNKNRYATADYYKYIYQMSKQKSNKKSRGPEAAALKINTGIYQKTAWPPSPVLTLTSGFLFERFPLL